MESAMTVSREFVVFVVGILAGVSGTYLGQWLGDHLGIAP